jgi:hypothetical protein
MSEFKKMSMLARMRRWRGFTYLRDEYNLSAKRVNGRAWGSHSTPTFRDYYIEIGDSTYGKKGTWKTEIDIGTFKEHMMPQLETELKLSNPEVFLDNEVKMRKIGYT